MNLVAGRGLTPQDAASRSEDIRVAVVSESFARYYFGSNTAVGRRFGWGDPPNVRYRYEIVGVAQDAIWGDLRAGPAKMAYFPAEGGGLFAVRVRSDPSAILPLVRAAVRAEDPALRIYSLETLPFLREQALAQDKLIARLASLFGAAALLLAGLGLYGMMSYAVARRRQEIGLRMALGADASRVLRMVVGEAAVLVAIGAAIGIPAALAAGRVVAGQLFGLRVGDPLTLAGATAMLAAVAAMAAWLPARRAARVDPSAALHL